MLEMLKRVTSLIIISTSIVSSVFCSGSGYCSVDVRHTMCMYQPNGCNTKLIANKISPANKNAILSIHNKLRNKVALGNEDGQPSATNIKQLKWEDELAAVAQRWADQCTFAHDANRNTLDNEFVGQNVFLSESSQDSARSGNFSRAIQMLYDEVTEPGFDPANINPFVFNADVGHYTQIVWAETSRIGCGYSMYKVGTRYRKLYICNYFPGGNIRDGEMYKIGDPASECEGGRSNIYPGLCDS